MILEKKYTSRVLKIKLLKTCQDTASENKVLYNPPIWLLAHSTIGFTSPLWSKEWGQVQREKLLLFVLPISHRKLYTFFFMAHFLNIISPNKWQTYRCTCTNDCTKHMKNQHHLSWSNLIYITTYFPLPYKVNMPTSLGPFT